jgi:phosphatidylglycerophosphate synthase
MHNIEDYKRKKWNAFITLIVFSVIFLGILLYIGKDGTLLLIFFPLMIIWTNFFVSYEKLSTKIDIFKELQNKNAQNKDGTES